MSTIDDAFDALKAWCQPEAGGSPFRLTCRITPGAGEDEIARAATPVAAELVELWSASRESWLFEDSEYGQWGLHLLSPEESAVRTDAEREARPDDLMDGDVVVGELLGDSDLLVFSPLESGERRYMVALPLDSRTDWHAAGSTAAEVLMRLLEADGEKYWESA